ncbi:MAG TPA: c-type cytochrome [Thiobacillaceae bacterium]|nr:c-type cytochrome [Thiobacillaceae bacterium]
MFKSALIVLMGGVLLTAAAAQAGDAKAGKAKSEKCAMCHGEDGKGEPRLAGMPVATFTKAIKAYKSGARDNKTMAKIAKDLSDKDIANLAAYYSAEK